MADPRRARSQPSNKMCLMCNGRVQPFYCMCTGSQVFICAECVPLHCNTTPGLPHVLMPITSIVSAGISFGAGKLEANLTKIDQSCEELNEAVNSLIASLTQYRDYWIGQLQALKDTLAEDISQAIAEVQASLADELVLLTEKYSMFLRNPQPASTELFNYSIDPSGSGLESLFKTEYPKVSHTGKVQCAFTRDLLAYIEPTQMKFFNFRKESREIQQQQWQQPVALRTTINVDYSSKYTFLDDGRLFCCGGGYAGGQVIRDTFLITAGGEVQPLGLMITARCNHGLIFLPQRRSVYVFGGYDGSNWSVKSEILTQPLTDRWRPLPDMSQARANFNPCLINGLVFLCGCASTLMEIFNPASNTFTSSVTLPEDEPSVLFEDAGMLVVISWTYITRYRVQGTALQQHSQQQHAKHYADSSSFPVVYDGKVYLSFNGSYRILDKNSGVQMNEI